MPEDNLIRPVFGRKTEDGEDKTSTDKVPDFELDVSFCLSNFELVWRAHLRGDEMTNYLFDDVGYKKTDTSLELRRPVVRTYTFEQFCERLLNSVRTEWRANPAFFGALFMEFHDRQNAILATIVEREEQVKALSKEDATILLKIAARAES